jgi:hypothetical protein
MKECPLSVVAVMRCARLRLAGAVLAHLHIVLRREPRLNRVVVRVDCRAFRRVGVLYDTIHFQCGLFNPSCGVTHLSRKT